MKVQLKVDRKLLKALQNDEKKKLIQKAVKLNTSEMQRQSARNVPVVTGNLKRSQQIHFEDDGLKGIVGFTADYAAYVELGTRFRAGQKYLGRAYNQQKDKFLEDIHKIVRA